MPIVLGSIHEREACQRDSALLQGCLVTVSRSVRDNVAFGLKCSGCHHR